MNASPTAAPASAAIPHSNRAGRRVAAAVQRKADHGDRKAARRLQAAEQAGALLQAGGYLRLPEVLALVPVSPSTWWEGVKTGRFPPGVKLGVRVTAWSAASIQALLNRLAVGEAGQ